MRIKKNPDLLSKIGFAKIESRIELAPSDLLSMPLGKKYRSLVYRLCQTAYPSRLIKSWGRRYGLFLFLKAIKPANSLLCEEGQ